MCFQFYCFFLYYFCFFKSVLTALIEVIHILQKKKNWFCWGGCPLFSKQNMATLFTYFLKKLPTIVKTTYIFTDNREYDNQYNNTKKTTDFLRFHNRFAFRNKPKAPTFRIAKKIKLSSLIQQY